MLILYFATEKDGLKMFVAVIEAVLKRLVVLRVLRVSQFNQVAYSVVIS
jgi:hypothetical protein